MVMSSWHDHFLIFKCTPFPAYATINLYDRYEFNQAGVTAPGAPLPPGTPPKTHTHHTARKADKTSTTHKGAGRGLFLSWNKNLEGGTTMNDHLMNGTPDELTPDSAFLDLGSFDGFDPFAEGEQPNEIGRAHV